MHSDRGELALSAFHQCDRLAPCCSADMINLDFLLEYNIQDSGRRQVDAAEVIDASCIEGCTALAPKGVTGPI